MPSRSNAPVTFRLIVVPIPNLSEFARSLNPRDSALPIKPDEAAAVAATFAAEVIPPALGTVMFGVLIVGVGVPPGATNPEANGIAPVEGARARSRRP